MNENKEKMEKIINEKKIKTKENTKKMLNDYKKFASKGNAIDMAVGIAIGSAFTAIVNSIVSSVISPIVSLLTNNIDLSSLFVTIKGEKFDTLAEAKAAGSLVITYGELINSIINFLIISFVLFIVVSIMKKSNKKKETVIEESKKETTKTCPYCLSTIPLEACKCAFCTSDLREDDENKDKAQIEIKDNTDEKIEDENPTNV